MKENVDLNSKIKSSKFKKISIQLGVGTLVNIDVKIPKKKSKEVNSIDS